MAINPSITGLSIIVLIVIIQCIITLFLLHKFLKIRNSNFLYLAFFNFFIGMNFILSSITVYTNIFMIYLLFFIFAFTGNLFLVLFIQNTFCKEKKSPLKIILLVLICFFIVHLIVLALNPDLTAMLFIVKLTLGIIYSSGSLITGVWLAKISLSEYKKYKSMPLNPWIKKRYLFSGVIAISYALAGYHYLIYIIGTLDSLNPNRLITFLSLIYSVVLITIFSVGSLITWIMPEKLKNLFDRKFTPFKDLELSEEEIEKIFFEK